MCNGPGLNKVEFSNIDKSKYTFFGLNKIFLGVDRFGITPRYVAVVNKKVIEQAAAELQSLPATKFVSNRVGAGIMPEDPMTFRLNTADLPQGHERFSKDISRYVHEGWTVTHVALQIAYYMGFEEVYIVGMDHWFSQHKPGMENTEEVLVGPDRDHFDPGYFAGGQRWDLPDLANSEISYQEARQQYEAEGRRIVDCSVNGRCEIFEKENVSVLYG